MAVAEAEAGATRHSLEGAMAAREVWTWGEEAKGGGAMQRRAGDMAVADAASRLGWPRGSASWQSGGPTRCRAWCWRGKTDPPPWLTHRRRFLAAVDLETGVWGGKEGEGTGPERNQRASAPNVRRLPNGYSENGDRNFDTSTTYSIPTH